MEAQRCKTCGERHWERVCPNPPKVARARGLPSFVTKPAWKPAPREVPRSVPQSRVSALQAEVDMLTAEVAQLKRQLAESNAKLARATESATVTATKSATATQSATISRMGRPKTNTAMSSTERARRSRAKRKAEEALSFKG